MIMKYALQYYNGSRMVEDKEGLTMQQARDLWKEHQAAFERNVERGRYDAEMCIWESDDKTPYACEVRHLRADMCQWRNGRLYELVAAFPTADEW